MKKIAIIPARYASSRFPGKPLALLGNKPMIMWVYDAVSSSGLFDKVVVSLIELNIKGVEEKGL